jgi:hypothetical protein
MKPLKLSALALVFAAACSAVGHSQETDGLLPEPTVTRHRSPASATIISPGEVAATPEMWFYEQERLRYADPRQAVRAQAEYRAMQRSRRLAAMKWFGFSNSRPIANPDPVHGIYSPRFVGNGYLPSYWVGSGSSVIVAQQPARRY